MSAIFGIVQLSGETVTPGQVERMSNAMASLGPDGGSTWSEGPVGLGQRLMCFTPEDQLERQPLSSADGRYMLVTDARLDNREWLARALGIQPAQAAMMPDAALILGAIQRWGTDFLGRLVGPFTLAVWDTGSRTLVVACSPFGERPLFYVRTPQLFAFATMPRGVAALRGVPRVLNEEAVADYLLFGVTGASFLRGVEPLHGGHMLTLGPGGFAVRRYWEPDLNREIRYRRDEDYLGAARELLDQAVAAQLRSATPICISLSGGLDSTAVAATAAPLLAAQGQRLAAYTEVPPVDFSGEVPAGRYADEARYVEAMASMYPNLDVHWIRSEGPFFPDCFDDLLSAAEVLVPGIFHAVWITESLRRAWANGQRVLLTGVAGNFTISWDGSGLLPQLLRRGQALRAIKEAHALARTSPGNSALMALLTGGVIPLLPGPLLALVRNRRGTRPEWNWRLYSPINPAFAAEQQVEARIREERSLRQITSAVESRRARIHGFTSVLPTFAQLDAGYRGVFGVDSRHPLWDLRLVEFCLALPEDQYLRAGEPRRLVRQLMAGRVPPEILANRKRGLQGANWFERSRAARQEIALELEVLARQPLARRILDLDELGRLVREWPQGGAEQPQVIAEYRAKLLRGLAIGRLLVSFEAGG